MYACICINAQALPKLSLHIIGIQFNPMDDLVWHNEQSYLTPLLSMVATVGSPAHWGLVAMYALILGYFLQHRGTIIMKEISISWGGCLKLNGGVFSKIINIATSHVKPHIPTLPMRHMTRLHTTYYSICHDSHLYVCRVSGVWGINTM